MKKAFYTIALLGFVFLVVSSSLALAAQMQVDMVEQISLGTTQKVKSVTVERAEPLVLHETEVAVLTPSETKVNVDRGSSGSIARSLDVTEKHTRERHPRTTRPTAHGESVAVSLETCDVHTKGDMNRDGVITQIDLDLFLPLFGMHEPPATDVTFWGYFAIYADYNCDGVINISDLGMLLAQMSR